MEMQAMPGAVVKAKGYTFTIGEVWYSYHFEREGWDIEFLDTEGNYHHWLQWQDGGTYTPAMFNR